MVQGNLINYHYNCKSPELPLCSKTKSREYYNRKKNDLKSRSKTNDKPEVEKWAKEYLRSKLQDEYELYNLIKRIFYYKIGKLGFDDFK